MIPYGRQTIEEDDIEEQTGFRSYYRLGDLLKWAAAGYSEDESGILEEEYTPLSGKSLHQCLSDGTMDEAEARRISQMTEQVLDTISTDIGLYKRYLNKYDVIHIDIQWFLTNCDDIDNFVAFLTKSILNELKVIYPMVVTSEITTIPQALSNIREKTGNKFIVIIDEWDVIIRDEAAKEKVQEDYINFLRGMFKGVEPTKYIKLAYIAGILPIKKEKTQSALNNFDEFTMLSAGAFASYIGFTDDEVKVSCACC